jgi:hypothetical protein
MVGSGALIECLDHPDVEKVLVVGRRSCGIVHDKVEEVLHGDFLDYSDVLERFRDYDACLFCLGVSAAGMSEADYTRFTYDFATAAARALREVNPALSFCYISATGADSAERSRIMWARVRGRLENHLLAMEGGPTWVFRPGYIQPMKGVTSRTKLYRALYVVSGPMYPVLNRMARAYVTSTDRLGLALIRAAREGAPLTHLENRDINALAEAETGRLQRPNG